MSVRFSAHRKVVVEKNYLYFCVTFGFVRDLAEKNSEVKAEEKMVGVVKVDTQEQLQKALSIREEVFVREQKVPKEDEYDQFDNTATHFLALDSKGETWGAARWRETEKGVKLERFAVKKEARGKGIGSMLLESVLEDITIHFQGKPAYLYLHAQLSALPLYEKFGFQKEGDIFEECGIKHYKMSKSL